MPHDRSGKLLEVGDRVTIEATVAAVHAGEDYCNVTLAIGHELPHGPENVHGTVTLNARQVEKFFVAFTPPEEV
jgi:hypothetical protein